MTFDEYTRSLGNLSSVKLLIIRTLWDSGNTFPRGWVKSSTLLSLTGQKYFDRRIRELRDERGCDIETISQGSDYLYRLTSPQISISNPRSYLSNSDKVKLFTKHKYTCQVCGKPSEAGIRGLQADHKVPLIRGGSNDLNNWQPLCNECNVSKRGACKGCLDDCSKCPWAFPEKTGMRVIVNIPVELLSLLKANGFTNQSEINRLVIDSLKDYLVNN